MQVSAYPQPQQPQGGQPPKKGKIVVSMNPVRERVMLDIDGNQIDPRTKRIIKLAKDVI